MSSETRWPAAVHALYRAYWVTGTDLTRDEAITAALAEAGVPRTEIEAAVAAADGEAIRSELRRRTDEAVALGIFGAPAMLIRRDGAPPILLWGQDRLHWLEAVLDGWDPDRDPGGVRRAPPWPGTARSRSPRTPGAASISRRFRQR